MEVSSSGQMTINGTVYEYYMYRSNRYIRLNCTMCNKESIVRVRQDRDLPKYCKVCAARNNGKLYDGVKQIGKIITEEQRKHMSDAHIGNKHTEEQIAKMKVSITKSWENEEIRNKRLINQTEAFKREDVKEKLSNNQKRIWSELTPELRDKRLSGVRNNEDCNKKRRDAWNRLTDEEKRDRIYASRLNVKPNTKETILGALLDYCCPEQYRYCGNNDVIINGKNPDFININGQKKVIEMNGDYYHSEIFTGTSKEDEENQRIELFKSFGFDCLVIWEHELDNKSDVLAKTITKLLEFNSREVVH
jgi:very-short-patch-repair endonuclease